MKKRKKKNNGSKAKGHVVAATLPVQVAAGVKFVRFKKKVKPSTGSKVKVRVKVKFK